MFTVVSVVCEGSGKKFDDDTPKFEKYPVYLDDCIKIVCDDHG